MHIDTDTCPGMRIVDTQQRENYELNKAKLRKYALMLGKEPGLCLSMSSWKRLKYFVPRSAISIRLHFGIDFLRYYDESQVRPMSFDELAQEYDEREQARLKIRRGLDEQRRLK